jgi:hypothetical protein
MPSALRPSPLMTQQKLLESFSDDMVEHVLDKRQEQLMWDLLHTPNSEEGDRMFLCNISIQLQYHMIKWTRKPQFNRSDWPGWWKEGY